MVETVYGVFWDDFNRIFLSDCDTFTIILFDIKKENIVRTDSIVSHSSYMKTEYLVNFCKQQQDCNLFNV